MKKEHGLTSEMLECLQRVEREARFWQKLEAIGFKRHNSIACMESISHFALPIRHSFYMDVKKMEIEKMTIETGTWVVATDGGNIMTCENFIKYMILQIRKLTTEILDKLDTVTL
jgi:hypothetical protein